MSAQNRLIDKDGAYKQTEGWPQHHLVLLTQPRSTPNHLKTADSPLSTHWLIQAMSSTLFWF
jgi:hypothetical protein